MEIASICLIQCDPDLIRFHNWLSTKDLKSNLFHMGLNIYFICSSKSRQICVHTVLWKVYNKYCLTVCSKNDIKYLFQMLYFLPYIVYLCMHGQIFQWLCWRWGLGIQQWMIGNDVECSLMMWLLGGIVHMWSDKVVDCVMCPLMLPLTFVGGNMKQIRHLLNL